MSLQKSDGFGSCTVCPFRITSPSYYFHSPKTVDTECRLQTITIASSDNLGLRQNVIWSPRSGAMTPSTLYEYGTPPELVTDDDRAHGCAGGGGRNITGAFMLGHHPQDT